MEYNDYELVYMVREAIPTILNVIAGKINLYSHCQNVTVSDNCPIGTERPIGNHPR